MLRELDHREGDGGHVRVTLYWDSDRDAAIVVAEDRRLGVEHVHEVAAHQSVVDVFRHPFSYDPTTTRRLDVAGEKAGYEEEDER